MIYPKGNQMIKATKTYQKICLKGKIIHTHAKCKAKIITKVHHVKKANKKKNKFPKRENKISKKKKIILWQKASRAKQAHQTYNKLCIKSIKQKLMYASKATHHVILQAIPMQWIFIRITMLKCSISS